MICFELQKNKVIFCKGNQKISFAGENYKKLYKILSKISRNFKIESRYLYGVTWGGWSIKLGKILKIGEITLTCAHWLKVVTIWRKSEKGVYYPG